MKTVALSQYLFQVYLKNTVNSHLYVNQIIACYRFGGSTCFDDVASVLHPTQEKTRNWLGIEQFCLLGF